MTPTTRPNSRRRRALTNEELKNFSQEPEENETVEDSFAEPDDSTITTTLSDAGNSTLKEFDDSTLNYEDKDASLKENISVLSDKSLSKTYVLEPRSSLKKNTSSISDKSLSKTSVIEPDAKNVSCV